MFSDHTLGFRPLSIKQARGLKNHLVVLPVWKKGEESIPIETDGPESRDEDGNPTVFRVPMELDDEYVITSLKLFWGKHKRTISAMDEAQEVTLGDLKLEVEYVANSFAEGLLIDFRGLPADSYLVVKCGSTSCNNIMAVPFSFWEGKPVDFVIDPAIYTPDDPYSQFFCWHCWEPMELILDEGGSMSNICDEDEASARAAAYREYKADVEAARAARPIPEWMR